ncbi:MAG: hypothetical protein HOP08_14855 [Cyclobacteriaceae bacterium]|nr:hypothetical protein [Cyclobacteriaceae bacterium]
MKKQTGFARILFLECLLLLTLSCQKSDDNLNINYTGTGSVSRGQGTSTTPNLLSGCNGSRVSSEGTIKALDGTTWTLPGENQFAAGAKASDLYNDCNNVRPSNISQASLPASGTIIDSDGTIITAYVFADNYFELYVNGVLIGVDPVPYTPFNSSVMKFKVKKPYTIAFKLIDWEENLGVGSEANNGNPFHAGDAGLVATFSDGTKTDGTWKAQTFYIAPLEDVNAVKEESDGTRSSASASTTPGCDGSCLAIHWPIPLDWNSKAYDDSGWPGATIYTAAAAGATNKLAYSNFTSTWAGASFIWSSNLVLDNVVLVRKTVQ